MTRMFYNAKSFNRNLSSWNVENVKWRYIFNGNVKFNPKYKPKFKVPVMISMPV